MNRLLPDYHYSYLDFSGQESYLLRLPSTIKSFPTRKNSIKMTFFPYNISEYHKIKVGIKNAKSIIIFKNYILRMERELFMLYLWSTWCKTPYYS